MDRALTETQRETERPLAEPVSWSNDTRVVLEVDHAGTILRATPGACRLLARGGELAGRPFVDLLSQTDRRCFSHRSAWGDPHIFSSLLLVDEESSTPRGVIVGARPAEGSEENPTTLLWGRPPDPLDLREARVLAAARYEIVGQLASALAHELNNTLSTVTTFSDLLLAATERNSTAWEDLTEIKEAALEAADVARSLDLFGGARSKGAQRVRIDDVVARLTKLMRRFLPGEIVLETTVAEDCPLVQVDPTDLEASLMALIANARDAMPDGGTLTLCAEPYHATDPTDGADAWLRIQVMDTGAGPPPEGTDAAAPFFSTKSIDRGTGLGTTVAHRLAVALGGRLSLRGRDGGGAVACLELPGCPDGPSVDMGVAT